MDSGREPQPLVGPMSNGCVWEIQVCAHDEVRPRRRRLSWRQPALMRGLSIGQLEPGDRLNQLLGLDP